MSFTLASAIRRSMRLRSSAESWLGCSLANRATRGGVGRVAIDRPAKPGPGFVKVADLLHEPPHIEKGFREFGVQPQRRLVLLHSFIIFAIPLQNPAQVIVELWRVGSSSIIRLKHSVASETRSRSVTASARYPWNARLSGSS